MLEEHPLMAYLDFGYSFFGKPQVKGNNLRIPVREFAVLKEFPNFQNETVFSDGFIVLKNVQSSKRRIAEYETEERQGFQLSYLVDDGPFPMVNKTLTFYEFDLSGYCDDPPGFVEWFIIAESIEIDGGKIKKIIRG